MSKMPVPFIFYARKQNVLSVKVSETEKQRCTIWYNGVSSEEANQKVCTAKGVRGMQKKSCIGVKRKAGDDGKCKRPRLHSWKYNGKKLYCTDCFAYKINEMKLRDTRVGFVI
jgi:hypothetical protein